MQHQQSPSAAGAFDPLKPVAEQRCASPGQGLGVNLTMDEHGAIIRTHGHAYSILEYEAMLRGGERNLVTEPVRLSPSSALLHGKWSWPEKLCLWNVEVPASVQMMTLQQRSLAVAHVQA